MRVSLSMYIPSALVSSSVAIIFLSKINIVTMFKLTDYSETSKERT